MSEVEGQLGDLGRRGLGETFLLLFPLSVAQIFFLSAFVQLWMFLQLWCKFGVQRCRKATGGGKAQVMTRGTKSREKHCAQGIQGAVRELGGGPAHGVRTPISGHKTITVLPCGFTCVL